MADESTQATGGTTEQPEQAAASERTFTQEEVNRLVGEAGRKERSKYEGYVAADELEALRTERDAATAERDALAAEKARAALVAKVAKEAKLPAEVVGMLSAADEDGLAAQAKALLKLYPAYPARTDDGGGRASAKRTTAQQFADAIGDIL